MEQIYYFIELMFIIILSWVDLYLFIYFNIYIFFIGFCQFIFSRSVFPLYLYLQIYWYMGGSDAKESTYRILSIYIFKECFHCICIFKFIGIWVAQMLKSLPAKWETQVRSLHWEDPLEKGMETQSSTLA